MPLESQDALFLKIGIFQAAANGRLAILVLAGLVLAYMAGRRVGWW